ncbi:hypothetical protein NEOLEDRAFT_1184282 [Neolentinus lepideus HHB14362 ss-1]|uniref:Protein kinase domain-containing protein n=1 Tax=Neolentinus lepideus HHB14362 ss-1 TaxID=1314782 RepID=A0A165MKI6_9AGAM|nr:hypothetical protein NEOLEDRAFT_1184282 [Neolentinus lepideus HHB14362 ss-1]
MRLRVTCSTQPCSLACGIICRFIELLLELGFLGGVAIALTLSFFTSSFSSRAGTFGTGGSKLGLRSFFSQRSGCVLTNQRSSGEPATPIPLADKKRSPLGGNEKADKDKHHGKHHREGKNEIPMMGTLMQVHLMKKREVLQVGGSAGQWCRWDCKSVDKVVIVGAILAVKEFWRNSESKKEHQKKICNGVEYLHSLGLAHRDLKLNCVMTTDNVIKLIDFGTATVFHYPGKSPTLMLATGITRSDPYLAPEVLSQE